MANMKQVYDFAVKWRDKFRDPQIDYLDLVDHWLADDCEALGFEMDGGRAFKEEYGNGSGVYEGLNRIIDDVTDISLLGSAIYSNWRYFNHWAYDAEEILEPMHREWFILALSRLASLSKEEPFKGNLKAIQITSNTFSYHGTIPEKNEEVEQKLIINNDGSVYFSGYRLDSESKQYERIRSRDLKIDLVVKNRLFEAVGTYFCNDHTEEFIADTGTWFIELTNDKGITYDFRGSLCAIPDHGKADLSELIREIMGMSDLYVLDGNSKQDVINKVTLDYHRITKIETRQGIVTWDATERLVIDRATETLEYVQSLGTGCKISHKYEIEGGVENLLEHFDAKTLFTYVEGNPDDVIDTPNETRDYKITLEYREKPSRTITGSYDKKGLPEDFGDFAEKVYEFIRFYGFGEMLFPSAYDRVKRRKSEYIFCSITFDEEAKSYYYLADDDDLEVGDFVFVPVGKENHKSIGKVVKIEYFSEEDAPFPLKNTKHIICKCTDTDF